FVDIKRRGLPADMPVFLPGFGAYVRWQNLGVSPQTRAAVSLAGPLAGWLASAACTVFWWTTGTGLWAALARAGAWLNALNMIPLWVVDGGQAIAATSKSERAALLLLSLLLCLIAKESVFLLVALGMGYRLFTKDQAPDAGWVTTTYFAFVLTLLALVLR